MAGIGTIGMASGLPPNIVEQLMQVERIPIQTLETKKGKDQEKLKLVNDLDAKLTKIGGSIGQLASNRGFNSVKLNSGDPNIVQGSVDPEQSVNGSWNIEVIELAQKAAAITNGFPDKDKTEIGVGYLRFDTPAGEKEIYIAGQNSTLEGVARTINQAGMELQATVINDKKDPDNPFRLMISGTGVGNENEILYPTIYMLDGDQDMYFDEKREAKNGRVKVDGFELEIPDNALKEIIPGVTLDLKQAAPGRSVNISVKEDQEVVQGKVKEFVDSMNEVLKFIQTQNRMTKETDTTKTLGGDAILRTIEARMRQLIQDPVMGTGSAIQRLNEIGIAFNREGHLDFDEKRFNSTLMKAPSEVQKFFAGDGFNSGFIPKLKKTLTGLTDFTFGPLANKRKGLQNMIDRNDQRIEGIERRLESKEKMLKMKFSNLEEKISRIQGQGAMLQGKMG